jgi:hypothetical protein
MIIRPGDGAGDAMLPRCAHATDGLPRTIGDAGGRPSGGRLIGDFIGDAGTRPTRRGAGEAGAVVCCGFTAA